jgi:hypothetical protein
MASYLTLAQWKTRSRIPATEIDDIAAAHPGKLENFLEEQSERAINARLRKRYSAPFSSPYPIVVLAWLRDLVDLDVYMLRGFNPTSQQDQLVADKAKLAQDEILEAANSETGLFDLPLRQDTTTSGISKGGPMGYSEASPYAWTDAQREAVSNGG